MIAVQNLSIARATNTGAPIVDNISFTIKATETLALVGASGNGKTLTALALLGLLPQGLTQTGNIEGIAPRDMAMVFQNPQLSLNPIRNIGKQLCDVILAHRPNTERNAAQNEAIGYLDDVGIANAARRMKDHPHQFSGGQQQRIVIALALASRPKFLIADEPTTALDAATEADILTLIKRLQKMHDFGILLITHDLAVVARTANRLAMLYEGKIVERMDASVLHADQQHIPNHPYSQRLFADYALIQQKRAQRAAINERTPLLTVASLHAAFGTTPILRDVSFSIARGERVALVGASGSGKTTLASAIAGLLPKGYTTRGDITWHNEGRTKNDLPAQMVFQNPHAALNPKRTVRQSLTEAVERTEVSNAEICTELSELMSKVQLPEPLLDAYPTALSGGQAQRVAIARAMAAKPSLLICDEPTSALDAASRKHMLALIATLPMTLLVISHDAATIAHLAERTLRMRQGGLDAMPERMT